MSEEKVPLEDLMVLARRSESSESQRRRLQMLLGASAVDEWLYTTGADYDCMVTEEPGDVRRLSRMVSRIAERHGGVHRMRKPGLVLGVLGAITLISLGAAALTRPWEAIKSHEQPTSSSASSLPAPVPPQSDPVPLGFRPRAKVERPAFGSADIGVDLPSARPLSSQAPDEASGASTQKPKPASALELFTTANALRKAGRTEEAAALYRRLQKEQPHSQQALVSHVLLGRLLLQSGATKAAQQQFAAYLARQRNGRLAEEALYGSATAFEASGSLVEARRAWQLLLFRFPSSIYAKVARDHLGESD